MKNQRRKNMKREDEKRIERRMQFGESREDMVVQKVGIEGMKRRKMIQRRAKQKQESEE